MRNPAKLRLLPAARDLALGVYAATADFPSDERFGLTSQLRRAAVSVGSNIAEGAHRQSDRAFLPFLHQSLGSTGELLFQLDLAQHLAFGDQVKLLAAIDHAEHMRAMTIRFMERLEHD